MRTLATSLAAIGLLFGATIADAGPSTRRRDMPITLSQSTNVLANTRIAVTAPRQAKSSARRFKKGVRRRTRVWGDPHVSERLLKRRRNKASVRGFVSNTWPGAAPRLGTKRRFAGSAAGNARMAVANIPGGVVVSAALSGTKKLPAAKTKAFVGGAANMATAVVPGGTILSAALSGAGKASSTAAALKRPGKRLRRVRFKPGKSLRSVVKAK